MKKKFFASLLIIFIGACACGQRLYPVGPTYRWGYSKEEARYKAGTYSLSNRHDRTGALVKKSTYNSTVYSLNTGWLLAKGTINDVTVYFRGTTTKINKKAYGTTKEWRATVEGQECIFIIDVSRAGTFGRLIKNGYVVNRYTF